MKINADMNMIKRTISGFVIGWISFFCLLYGGLPLMIIIAIISVIMAGSNQRYLADYSWMLVLSGILIFMAFYNKLKYEESKNILMKLLAITTLFTFIIGICSGIVSEKEYMKNKSPETYYKTKYTVCFWE